METLKKITNFVSKYMAVIVIAVIVFRPTGIMGWYDHSKFKKNVNAKLDAVDAKLFGKRG